MQDQHECFLFIANYHALTSVADPDQLRMNTQDAALDFLACGIDPEKTVFYRQSDVPEVHELTWLLSTITQLKRLELGHSYKDKTSRGISASLSLLSYPVLMASDILMVQSELVPVGRDQKQHVEMCRDIAKRFNNKFGEVFKIPEPVIQDSVAVVPGIDGQKMSKSYGNTIDIFGPLKPIRKQIMKIVTDSKGLEDAKDPESCHIFALMKLFASESELAEVAEKYRAGGYGYGHAKQALFEMYEAHFTPFREKRAELEGNLDYVEEVLQRGAERAHAVTSETITAARKAMGLA